MSYDIYLNDPVTGKTAEVPGHLMTGGTFLADYHSDTKTFTPALNTEAWLNITYNYSHYYYDAYEEGIRKIYGMSGADSIPVLNHMIEVIKEKYKPADTWLITKRTETRYYDKYGNKLEPINILLKEAEYERKEDVTFDVDEGDTSNYWMDTAANAMKPLYQLIALAKMRPDGVWDGD